MKSLSSGLTDNKRALAITGLVLAAACWGGNSIAGRMSVGDIPPVALSFWRWLFAFSLLMCVAGRQVYGSRRVVLEYRWQLMVLGFFSIGCFNTLLYLSAQTIPAINITLIQVSLPVFTLLLGIPLLRIYPTKNQITGLMVAVPGLVIILSKGSLEAMAGFAFGAGDLIMLLAVFCWGMYTVLLKRFDVPLSGAPLLTVLVGVGVCFLLPFYLWELSVKGGFAINSSNALLLSYVVIFASLVAYIGWNFGVSVMGAGNASMFNFLMPFFSGLFAIPLLGESLKSYHFTGALLIFTGLWLAHRKRS